METATKGSSSGEAEANIAAVRRLCEGWPWLSREDYADLFTPDCAYINMPWPEKRAIGGDQIFGMLSTMKDSVDIVLELEHIAAQDGVVFAQRIERLRKRADGAASDLYVAGVFEMKDGKIAVWRDYFDAAQIAILLGG